MAFKDPEKAREYHRQYMKAWYEKNKRIQVERNLKRRKKLWAWFAELKTTLKCSHCGENHPACLEFHHEDRSAKEITIHQAVWHQHWGKARILAEIAKCTVLCANCHRKVHWDEDLQRQDYNLT